ncbi:MAG: hypothetical protein ABI781_17730 [Burkholderiales bacterium]
MNHLTRRRPGGAGKVAMAELARADDQHTLILGHIGSSGCAAKAKRSSSSTRATTPMPPRS